MPGLTTMPAIDGGNDTVDTYFAFLIDRHLGDLSDNRVVAFVDGDTAATAGWKRVAPVAFLRELIEHAKEVGPVRQQSAAETVWVLSRRLRQFVDIAFHEKGILRGADRAPEHHRHMGVLEHATDAHIRDLVVGVGYAFDRLILKAAFGLVSAG
jgi:hypothetical protein